jgi:hypothetical protein
MKTVIGLLVGIVTIALMRNAYIWGSTPLDANNLPNSFDFVMSGFFAMFGVLLGMGLVVMFLLNITENRAPETVKVDTVETTTDSYTARRQAEIDAYTARQNAEINAYTARQNAEINAYHARKTAEIEAYHARRTAEINAYHARINGGK